MKLNLVNFLAELIRLRWVNQGSGEPSSVLSIDGGQRVLHRRIRLTEQLRLLLNRRSARFLVLSI